MTDPETPSVFDENGIVLLDSPETMLAVARELYEKTPTKWRGFVCLHETTDNPGYSLELTPRPPRSDRPTLNAFIGDRVQKIEPLGLLFRVSPEDWAGAQNG